MAQVPCTFRQAHGAIDHTPGSAITAGDVVVHGTALVTIATQNIAANKKGSLATCGQFRGPKVTGALSKGDAIFWDADGDPVGGDAGTGALTDDGTKGPFAGWVTVAAGASDETVDFELRSVDATDAETLGLADLSDVDSVAYTAGKILVADGTSKYADVAMSGDATIDETGAVEVSDLTIS